MLQTGHGMWCGGLQYPVTQPQLTVTALAPAVDVARAGEGQRVVAATGHPHHLLWTPHPPGVVSVQHPGVPAQPQLATVRLTTGVQLPLLSDQGSVVVTTGNVNNLKFNQLH